MDLKQGALVDFFKTKILFGHTHTLITVCVTIKISAKFDHKLFSNFT